MSFVLSVKFKSARLYKTTTARRIAKIFTVIVITFIDETVSSARALISCIDIAEEMPLNFAMSRAVSVAASSDRVRT